MTNAKFEKIDTDLFDVVDYLEDRGIDYSVAGQKNVSTGWIGISCVFCGDRSNHMGINLENKTISCFKCGKKGNILSLIMALDNCSFSKAKLVIEKFITKDFSNLIKKERNHAEITMYPGGVSSNFLPMHDKFISDRRYDRVILEKKYDILAIGPTCDDWKFRIVIPVIQNHEVVSFVARDVTNKAVIPYKNCPIEKCILQAKHTLYNLDSVKEGGTAIIVEGILDVWRIGNGAICTFGTQYTDEQVRLLSKKKLRMCHVMYDNDAVRQGRQLAHTISSVVSHVECIELKNGDPDDLTDDEVFQLRYEIGL